MMLVLSGRNLPLALILAVGMEGMEGMVRVKCFEMLPIIIFLRFRSFLHANPPVTKVS